MSNKFKNIQELLRYLKTYSSGKKSKTASSIGIVFEENGRNHWYDNGTCKVFQINRAIASLLSYLTQEEINEEKFLKLMKAKKISEEEFLTVVNKEDLLKGVKIESLANDFYLRYVHKQIQSGISQLILELTEDCNMRCGYCIYQDSYTGNRNFGHNSMTRDIAYKSIDLIAKEGDKKEIAITFYGGEPLLEFDLMKDCIEYSKVKLKNRKLSFSFTSNISLLNDEMVDYFRGLNNLSIMCSIDGPKEIHNQYRVYANGEGSFEKVYANLKKLAGICSENSSFSISVNSVYAPPYSIDKVKKINNFFKNIDWLPDSFNYQLGYPSLDTLPSNVSRVFYEDDYSLQNWYKENLSKGEYSECFYEGSFIKSLQSIHERNITSHASNKVGLNGCCTPGFRRLFVKTNGEFLSCERIGYSPSIGNVDKGLDFEKIYRDYIFSYSDEWSDKCNDCWSSKLCSICYVDRVNLKGVKSIESDNLCGYAREENLLSLKRYHQILNESPEALSILNVEKK